MSYLVDQSSFKVTPLYQYIHNQLEDAGLYIHSDNAKQTLQSFKNTNSFYNVDYYLGAIQYEGSRDYAKKEPTIVSFRFKRSNIPESLRLALEEITDFCQDKNQGPAINFKVESIAFKFTQLEETGKRTIKGIISAVINDK